MLIHSAVITGSVQLNNTDVSSITNVAGFATTASVNTLVVKTGSYASTSSVNELQSKTGSYATTSSVNNLQSVTGSYATTGSNQFNGNQSISGSITSNGTITAQTLVVQTVTSSIEFVTGSTRNGSLSSNTHEFTGSVLMSGSVTVGGAATFSGEIKSGDTITLGAAAVGGFWTWGSTTAFLVAGTGKALNLNPNGTSGTTGLSIATTGAATFSNSVSAPYYLVTSNIPSSTASTGYLDYSGGGTRLFSVGTSGATKGTFRFIAKGADDSSIEPLGISNTGAATFSSTVTTGDVLYVGAGGGGGGIWTWGATEAYIHSPTSKNLNLTTDGGLTKGLRITTSGAATFSSTVTATGLNINGIVGATQTSAGRIVQLEGSSNNQGVSINYRIVRHYPVVSSGNKLIIPFYSQGNLNSTTIVRIFGHGARFNTSIPLGFTADFVLGHLSALYNLSVLNSTGNIGTITVSGMNIEIAFNTAYTAATANGVYVTIDYMTNNPAHSIDVANITMN